MANSLPRFRFSLRFLLSIPIFLILWVALIAATTSQASLSNELQLSDGTVLLARDIKRHNLPFTSVWLRRHVELLEVTNGNAHEVLHRVSSPKLPPKGERMHPNLELKGLSQVVVSLHDPKSNELVLTFEYSIPTRN